MVYICQKKKERTFIGVPTFFSSGLNKESDTFRAGLRDFLKVSHIRFKKAPTLFSAIS